MQDRYGPTWAGQLGFGSDWSSPLVVSGLPALLGEAYVFMFNAIYLLLFA